MIYRAVLVRDTPFDTGLSHHNTNNLLESMRLLQVCSQIRSEAHDIFWSENHFELKLLPDKENGNNRELWCIDRKSTGYLLGWSKMISKSRARLIRSLTLGIGKMPSFSEQTRVWIYMNLSTLEMQFRTMTRDGVPVASIKAGEPLHLTSETSSIDQANATMANAWNRRMSLINEQEESSTQVDGKEVKQKQTSYAFGRIALHVFG